MEYMVEFDAVNGETWTDYIDADDWYDVVRFVHTEMAWADGGHADVYVDGEFVKDIEVDV